MRSHSIHDLPRNRFLSSFGDAERRLDWHPFIAKPPCHKPIYCPCDADCTAIRPRLLSHGETATDQSPSTTVPRAVYASRQQLRHHLAMHVGQPEIAALETVGQLGVIEAEQVQQRGVQVVDVNAILDDVEAELVGLRRA